MKIDVNKLKELVEAGDVSAIDSYILNEALEKTDVYEALEKGDVEAAAKANKEVLSELDSLKDTHHTKAMEKFKQKELPKLLDDAKDAVRKELAPDETPEQKRIRELEEAWLKEKQKSALADVRAKLAAFATGEDVKLDPAFASKYIDKFMPKTVELDENGEALVDAAVEAAKAELVVYATDYKAALAKEVEVAMKATARTDIGGAGGGQEQRELTRGEKLAKQNDTTEVKVVEEKYFK